MTSTLSPPYSPKRLGFTTSTKPEDKFGKLTVIHRVSNTRNGHNRWWCRCECGVEKEILATHFMSGKTSSCGCDRPKGRFHKQWIGHGEIHGASFSEIRRSALGGKGRAPIAFEVNIEYIWDLFLFQNRKCALSGVSICFKSGNYNTKSRGRDGTASLDRIDSGVGYIPGNVQWVHKDVNRMKSVFSQDRFIEVCRLVAQTHPLPSPNSQSPT